MPRLPLGLMDAHERLRAEGTKVAGPQQQTSKNRAIELARFVVNSQQQSPSLSPTEALLLAEQYLRELGLPSA